MGLTLITPPADEPVSLADAKAHLRVEDTGDDALITALIVAARREAEHRTGRALVTQTWKLTLDAFPDGKIELPRPPLASVSSIAYTDADGAPQTVDAGDYQVVIDELIGYVQPAYGKAWPSARQVPGTIAVTFVAGYGAAAAVPQTVKQWMLLQVGAMYENRAAAGDRQAYQLPFADGLLDSARVYW